MTSAQLCASVDVDKTMFQFARRNLRILSVLSILFLLPILYWYASQPHNTWISSKFQRVSLSQSLTSLSSTSRSSDTHMNESSTTLTVSPEKNCPILTTVHVGMVVASGGIGSRELYMTVKSVLMHRSTPLHFHFFTDDRAKTVLQTMLDTWLLPGIAHSYYDLREALQSVRLADSVVHCSQTLSIHLNLHLILPKSVSHIVVIEPTSVARVDLAQLWSVTVSREDHMTSLCQTACVTYCSVGTEVQMTGWGALGLNLRNLTAALERTGVREAVESGECSPGAIGSTVDEAVTELSGVDHLKLSQSSSDACETVKNFDGESLRHREVSKCQKPLIRSVPSAKELCKLFAWERSTQRRELPFLFGHSYTRSSKYDVTLATHLAHNRLDLLVPCLRHWDGPAVVAVYVKDSEIQGVVDFIKNSTILRNRTNVTYHLLFKIGPSYPFNHMRELGHRFVSTPYVFFLDVDYVASPGLYRTLRKKLGKLEFGKMSKRAVVIPAFETNEKNFVVPSNKSEMVKQFEKEKVTQFHKTNFDPGHGPTNYAKWTTAVNPYPVHWKNNYEPYCVLKTSVFSFDRRFVARFHDKCSHSVELHMAGYSFLVFPQSFVVHLPHPTSTQNTAKLKECSTQWYTDWIMDKRKQYNYTKNDVQNTMFLVE